MSYLYVKWNSFELRFARRRFRDYAPGKGIFPHIDQAVFGDVVASVSLGSSCVMEFSKEGHISKQLFLEPRSVVALASLENQPYST